jgi:hypothetical protein
LSRHITHGRSEFLGMSSLPPSNPLILISTVRFRTDLWQTQLTNGLSSCFSLIGQFFCAKHHISIDGACVLERRNDHGGQRRKGATALAREMRSLSELRGGIRKGLMRVHAGVRKERGRYCFSWRLVLHYYSSP